MLRNHTRVVLCAMPCVHAFKTNNESTPILRAQLLRSNGSVTPIEIGSINKRFSGVCHALCVFNNK